VQAKISKKPEAFQKAYPK